MIFGSNHATFLIGNLAHGAIFGVKESIALGSILFSVLHLALIQGVVFQTLAKVRYVGGHFFVWSGQLQLTYFVISLWFYLWPVTPIKGDAVHSSSWYVAGAGLLGSWVYLPIVHYHNHATFLTGNHAHGTMTGVKGYFALGSILSSVQHLVVNCVYFWNVDSAGPLGSLLNGTRRVRRSPPACVVFQTLAKARYVGGHFFVWSGQLQLTYFVIGGQLNIVGGYGVGAFLHIKPPKAPAFVPGAWPFMAFSPVIDGSEAGLLAPPLQLIEKGTFNKVP